MFCVKTNIGKEFLKLIDECFPPGHPLQKILNRRTVKISYSTTPNIEKIISGQNSKKLTEKETQTRTCNCTKNKTCPLNGECLKNNLVYHAKVTTSDQKSNSYIGMTSTEFKDRLATHKHTFKYINSNGQTALSKHIHDLKSKKIEHEVTWRIVDRDRPFSPISGICILCNREKFYILFHPELSDLNSRSEFYSHCRHIKSKLLIKKERKKTGPG